MKMPIKPYFPNQNLINALDKYQSMSSRTANKHEGELQNYALGLTGEAGEVADLVKKAVYHGHDINKDEIAKELGDTLWYLAQLARLAGLELSDIATRNIDKLIERYPEGFSSERSINRKESDC